MSEISSYCREIESYLCQKNAGHLIRVVGPSFEMVSGWASLGIPLKVAFRGVDRYCERYYAKGPRRRPVRIEFCEADVLDAFDEWRRAVGVGTGSGTETESSTKKPALASHIERAVARLTALRAGGSRSSTFDRAIDTAVRELDHLAADARRARGGAREGIVERLDELDREIVAAALAELPSSQADELMNEADSELAPFGARMTPEARERARHAAFHRLVREASGLPVLTYE